MRKIIIFILSTILVISLVGCSQPQKELDDRELEVALLIVDGKFDEARVMAKKLFKGNERLEVILQDIDEIEEIDKKSMELSKNTHTLSKLEIQPDRNQEYRGNYVYLSGKVKNISEHNINYFEIRVDFLGEGGIVLDSDYTNDRLILRPGDMREFEIMHKWNDKYEGFRFSVEDVR